MKIIATFVKKLYACHYDGEAINEYARLMDLWGDTAYLSRYAYENNISDVRGFVKEIRENARYIDNLMEEIYVSNAPLSSFFKPLNNLETGIKMLSLQKGRRYRLRVYAIKIDENLFLITGGAIKLAFRMQDHRDTQKEKDKLDSVKAYLKRNNVFDNDSFHELINENYEDE